MSKVFVNIGLSLDGYMAPEGMTMGKPEIKNWGANQVNDTSTMTSSDGPLTTGDFDCDCIFSNGNFVVYPEGIQNQ